MSRGRGLPCSHVRAAKSVAFVVRYMYLGDDKHQHRFSRTMKSPVRMLSVPLLPGLEGLPSQA